MPAPIPLVPPARSRATPVVAPAGGAPEPGLRRKLSLLLLRPRPDTGRSRLDQLLDDILDQAASGDPNACALIAEALAAPPIAVPERMVPH